MNYWQVAAGERGRNYSSVFIEFGVMLIGSGWPGPVPERMDWYKKHETQAIAFAKQVELGDIVVLKRPYHKQWEILAVGRVIGEYEYLEQFEDVDGWDLQHSRKVEWVLPRERRFTKGLTFGTFRRIHQPAQREVIHEILACTTCLEYFDLTDRQAVGRPTTMLKSVQSMLGCDTVSL